MATKRPIGLFDSGVGGLSIWREVVRHLPREATLYVADSVNCPYGSRPIREIQAFSAEIVEFLLKRGAKLIVVACNTASAAALEHLRESFRGVKFVGLEPAIKPAAEETITGHVGVLATAGTMHGDLYRETSRQHAQGVTVHQVVGEGLVELIEAGQLDTPETEARLREYLSPLLDAKVDQLVLGCTHYPLLMPLFERIAEGRMTVIDPSVAVARQVERVLKRHRLTAPTDANPTHRFFSTGDIEPLQSLATTFHGAAVEVTPLSFEV